MTDKPSRYHTIFDISILSRVVTQLWRATTLAKNAKIIIYLPHAKPKWIPLHKSAPKRVKHS